MKTKDYWYDLPEELIAQTPLQRRDAVRVGIVGEIFVKYSPLGNNRLEQFFYIP